MCSATKGYQGFGSLEKSEAKHASIPLKIGTHHHKQYTLQNQPSAEFYKVGFAVNGLGFRGCSSSIDTWTPRDSAANRSVLPLTV